MTHGPARTRTLALAATAVVAVALAACGGATDAAAPAKPASGTTFDRALRDLLPQSIRDKGIITVGTDASYAPMSFFGPDGRTIVGMEPDLAAAVGTVLGVRLTFQNVDFTQILPQVKKGTLDLGISAMTDTNEREDVVDFVNYFSAGTSIVVQRGNPAGITDVKDLCGKVVAVEDGTTQVDLMKRSQTNCERPITVKTYPTNSDALVQLRTGRAAAVLNDFPPASYLANDARTKSHFQLASTTQYEPGLYGVAVSKEQPGLRDAVEGALELLVREGGYRTVLTRWNVQAGGIAEVTVNSGR